MIKENEENASRLVLIKWNRIYELYQRLKNIKN